MSRYNNMMSEIENNRMKNRNIITKFIEAIKKMRKKEIRKKK